MGGGFIISRCCRGLKTPFTRRPRGGVEGTELVFLCIFVVVGGFSLDDVVVHVVDVIVDVVVDVHVGGLYFLVGAVVVCFVGEVENLDAE